MRLALVMSHAERRLDGARRELLWLQALARRGVAVRLFRMHAGTAIEQEATLDGAVHAIFCPSDDRRLPHAQRISASLRTEIEAFRPTLILFKGLGYAVNADIASALAPCPFGFIAGGATRDPILPRAELVLAEHQAQAEQAFGTLHAAGRCMILPKYFDPERIGDGSPATPPRYDIVNVGGFQDGRKNQAALLPLARRYRVCFLGGGPGLDAMRATAPRRARFLGQRRPHEVYQHLRATRLMVHVSLQDGLPRAVVEAMACGRPVIAYRSTLPAGLTHGEHGLLVTPETMEAEATALLEDPPRLAVMGAAARHHAMTTHGPEALDRAAERFLELVGR